MRIPEQGLTAEEIIATLEGYRGGDVPWQSGRAWAYVYDPGEAGMAIGKRAFAMYLTENALDPTAFPSLLRLENEVIGMVADHLDAPEGVVGNFTSGGTESIFLACKVARDHFRERHPGVARPRVILPYTAHAAFEKASWYLDLEAVRVPVDASFRADPDAVRDAVDDRTCLIVGSAPSYAHGVVDPIPALGQVALEKGVPLHVDACVGGFMLPYFRRFGAGFPDFDFSVPGVTSLSVDLHKYAFAPKGASVVLYRDRSWRRHQIYACAGWSGYTIVNTTVQSTKSGGPLAGAWAVLRHIGDAGYETLMRRMYEATRRVCDGIRAIDGLRLLVEPDTNLLAFTSDEVSVFHIVDEMKARNWYVQPQLGFAGSKENIHLSVNPKADGWVEDMLADLRASTEAARQLPSGHAAAFVQQAFAGVDATSLDETTFAQMLGAAGLDGVALPERMAGINEMLDALPPPLRERILIEFLNQLFVPSRGA